MRSRRSNWGAENEDDREKEEEEEDFLAELSAKVAAGVERERETCAGRGERVT